jgi:hypothetical protein
VKQQVPRLPPDFLSDLVVSVNIMRLSSKKAAYVVASESSVLGNPDFARDDKFKVGSEPLNLLVGSVAFSVSTQVRFGEGHTRLVPVHSRPVRPVECRLCRHGPALHRSPQSDACQQSRGIERR